MANPNILPANVDEGLAALTPAQRLFLFFYSQTPDEKKAAEQAGINIRTFREVWRKQPAFLAAWNELLAGEVSNVIRAAAADQAGKSFGTILELRDQRRNLRVALDAAKACLQAVENPTFSSHIHVTKEIGENWRRALQQLLPDIRRMSRGEIVDAEDWNYVEDGEEAYNPIQIEGPNPQV